MSEASPSPAPILPDSGEDGVRAFIEKWKGKDGGERANYQLFIGELCALLGTAPPGPASSDPDANAYVFERQVEFTGPAAGEASPKSFGYIDCYKRGCFVFETKQGVEKKTREALSQAGRERAAPPPPSSLDGTGSYPKRKTPPATTSTTSNSSPAW